MSLIQEDFDEIQSLANTIESAMNDLSSALRRLDPHLYEQWKAYGKQVTNEFVSMGPNLFDVVEKLKLQINDEEESNVCGKEECPHSEKNCEDCEENHE